MIRDYETKDIKRKNAKSKKKKFTKLPSGRVEDLKNYLRIDGNFEDESLGVLYRSCLEEVELYTGLSICKATWEYLITLKIKNKIVDDYYYPGIAPYSGGHGSGLSMDEYMPIEKINIPKNPLIGVTSINTIDKYGEKTLIPMSKYSVISGETVSAIVFNERIFLFDNLRSIGNMEIVFEAGHDTDGAIPDMVKQVIRDLASYRYQNNGEPRGNDAEISILRQVDHLKTWSFAYDVD